MSEWPGIIAELKDIGAKGADGLIKALQSADWKTRTTAAMMIGKADIAPEPVVAQLKQALRDSNQKVRSCALGALRRLGATKAEKRREFLPLIIPLLADPTRRVRRDAAVVLRECAADVPLEAAVRALAQEADGRVLRHLKPLVLAILEAREEKAKS